MMVLRKLYGNKGYWTQVGCRGSLVMVKTYVFFSLQN